MSELVTLDDIKKAAARIDGRCARTPLVSFTGSDAERPLLLKVESLQPTGAFKLRGAFNKVMSVLDAARERGVVAHSSGKQPCCPRGDESLPATRLDGLDSAMRRWGGLEAALPPVLGPGSMARPGVRKLSPHAAL